MRHYELYIFEEDVVRHYYGQESKLFYLFYDFEKAIDPLKELIRKQIDFITKPIPTLLLQQKVKQALSSYSGYSQKKNTHLLQLQTGTKAELVIGANALYLTADGSQEVETMFFEILRKCEPTFFAYSFDGHRYGWLKPITPLVQSNHL